MDRWAGARIALGLVAIILSASTLSACGKTIDDAVTEINSAEGTIQQTSDDWRDQVDKLAKELNSMESNVSSDSREAVVLAANQVSDLSTQVIDLSDAKAQGLIAQAGVEFRCDANYVKQGVVSELSYIVSELKFWRDGKTPASPPPHTTCWVDPTAVSLYPSGSTWSVDTSNMADKGIIHLYGYDFSADALPTVELEDVNSKPIRDAMIKPAYVTHYQIDLDLSDETFAGVQPGARLALLWPDTPDPTTISLTLNPGAHLQISNPVFSVPSPTATVDPVALQVTVTNTGGTRSLSFTTIWQPDPKNDGNARQTKTHEPLNPGQSAPVNFDSYLFLDAGTIISSVSLDNGDDTEHPVLQVKTPPPAPPTEQNLTGFPQTITKAGNLVGGFGEEATLGGPCDPNFTRSSHSVTTLSSQGPAVATDDGWAASSDPHNCQLKVHFSIKPGGDNKNWVKVQVAIRETRD